MTASLLRTTSSLAAAQAAVIGICWVAYGLADARSVLFLALVLGYHGVLFAALLALRPLFVLTCDGRPLERVNVSNVLSLIRLSSLPTVVYLIISAPEGNLIPVILPYLVLVFLTDFFDGRIARRFDQVTAIGRYLDSVSDYLVLSATLFVYVSYSLLPWWFVALVVARLGVVAVGNTLLYFAQGHVEPETSYLSKASVFAIMLLFAAKVLSIPYVFLFSSPSPLTIERLDRLELMVAGIVAVSTFEKIGLIARRLAQAVRPEGCRGPGSASAGDSAVGAPGS